MSYSDETDLDNLYGSQNIDLWSDLDNEGVRDQARILWANEQAQYIIDGRLTEGPYDSFIPFGASPSIVPPLIRLLSGYIAGVMLYDTRRVVDATSDDQIAQQRINASKMMNQVASGQLKLRTAITNIPLQKDGKNEPFNVPVEALQEEGDVLTESLTF